jgi:hypothetical protein
MGKWGDKRRTGGRDKKGVKKGKAIEQDVRQMHIGFSLFLFSLLTFLSFCRLEGWRGSTAEKIQSLGSNLNSFLEDATWLLPHPLLLAGMAGQTLKTSRGDIGKDSIPTLHVKIDLQNEGRNSKMHGERSSNEALLPRNQLLLQISIFGVVLQAT